MDIKFNKKTQPSLAEAGGFEKPRKVSSVLFSRGKRTTEFFTEDSRRYITPREAKLLRKGIKLDREIKKWDCLSSRIVSDFERYVPSKAGIMREALEERLQVLNDSFSDASRSLLDQLTVVRLWNVSIVASILFGMVTMTFIYRYLGQGASAQLKADATAGQEISTGKILGSETVSNPKNDAGVIEAVKIIENPKIKAEKDLKAEITTMVKGYPIEDMVPYIAKQDRTVAAFIVGIAMKESTWGLHHPVLNGKDCYNYWGYRGQRELMGSGGHTCFNSPEDAVNTVAKRLSTLVEEYGKDTPSKMVLWKCGTECKTDSGAKKWISDVDIYFERLNNEN